jgi:transposase
MSNKARRYYSPAEKMAILRKHLIERVPVSEICEQYKIGPTVFYQWQKQLFENGSEVFSNGKKEKAKPNDQEQRIAQLEQKLQGKAEVLSELMEEHIELKKSVGESSKACG